MPSDEMEIINPTNNLKNKVREGGPGAVDLATLERAEQAIGSAEVQAIKVHVDALKIVIQTGMKGDGGANGQALVDGIRKVGDKLIR